MENIIKEKIDLLINHFLQDVCAPGVAVGVIEKNKVIYAKGFGVLNIDKDDPITENTLFHMASVSKPFVATGIMQLVEQGKISLDDPVIKHVPYFKIKGEDYETITIREMLRHISGMPDVHDYEWDKPQYDDEALERHVRNLAKRELIPGQRGMFKYSNLAFEVLGDLISKVSGVSFETYMKNNILNPIGMTESTFLNREVNKDLLATPHRLDVKNGYGPGVSEVFPYNRRHAPSSTLYSNIVEMFNWAMVNLNRGVLNGVRILKEDSYSELFKAAAKTGWAGYNSEIGLSWFLGEYKGTKVISHSGGDTGFSSNFLMLPEKEIGLVLMSNSEYAGLRKLTEALLDIILGHECQEIKQSIGRTLTKIMVNEGIESALKEYSFIKENCKDKYYSEEYEFNNFGYALYGADKLNEAIEILKLGISEFPQAANLYDSLGEMYLKSHNIEMAMKSYEKAVELNPQNQEAIDIVKELKSR